MAKVYIINRGAGHDFTPAEEFGTLVYLSEGTIKPFDTGDMHRQFSAILALSGPNDYILLTSLTVMCVLAACIFVAKHNCLNLLIYSKGNYVERRIVFDKEEP